MPNEHQKVEFWDQLKTMYDLKNTTYVLIEGRPDSSFILPVLYAKYVSKYIDFNKYLILTPDSSKYRNHNFIEFKYIPPLLNKRAYSTFIVEEFHKYIQTEFCIIYQHDGSIINPNLWNQDYLNYDFIGSPWPITGSKGWKHNLIDGHGKCCRVGNGGFSLRSKKFLKVSSKLKNRYGIFEDIFLTCINRSFMRKEKIKIPHHEIAKNFSIEHAIDSNHNLNSCFGFHAPRNIKNNIIKSYTRKIIQDLGSK